MYRVCSFFHWFIHSHTISLVRSFVGSLVCSFSILSFVCLLICWFVHWLVGFFCPFVSCMVPSFVSLLVPSFIHWFLIHACSLVCSFRSSSFSSSYYNYTLPLFGAIVWSMNFIVQPCLEIRIYITYRLEGWVGRLQKVLILYELKIIPIITDTPLVNENVSDVDLWISLFVLSKCTRILFSPHQNSWPFVGTLWE